MSVGATPSVSGACQEDFKGQVLIFSVIGCPQCLRAKGIIQNLYVPYIDISIDKYDKSVRESLANLVKKRTVPQIFFNEIHVGGTPELEELVRDKRRLCELVSLVRHRSTPPGLSPPIPKPSLLIDHSDTVGISTNFWHLDDVKFVCEPDEYYELIKQIRRAGIIRDHRPGLGLRVMKNTFTGKDLVRWLVTYKEMDHEQAESIGEALVSQCFGVPVVSEGEGEPRFRSSSRTYYRLIEDDDGNALNAGNTSQCRPRPASDLGETLRNHIAKIYNSYISLDGRTVDYTAISVSPEFAQYQELTKHLHRLDLVKSSREEKLAFFLNVYNALVIHAKVVRGSPANLWQRWKFFNTVTYIIGGYSYSLQDMEHGILRGNKRVNSGMGPPFNKSDPRLRFILPEGEALIHFALNCGAKSCPAINTYTSQDVMNELASACSSYLDSPDGCSLDSENNKIFLSQIFKWYREDFGHTPEKIVAWVYEHLSADDSKKVKMAEMVTSGKFKLIFIPYDWTSNTK